ncbi:hypothetical protein, variant [Aphanomyces astaci]|uniref:phospholipase D n=1 Tax=Aphanomyces astaci TaxID=112090 RepID=W4FPK2_APHAT|nr:hypothetical protein, variant [Aphanomyces astaci]ETV69400.1 hypothetical protein, variant [Aphanomyces astaci]|eukprot:XP_009841257.1 hypothetical protein, variant [Aphanomyces astaci]
MAAWWLFGGNKYGQDADNTLEIFEHAPTVKVKSVRIDDDWPVKTVEFEVKLRYKDISREIYLPKSNVYRLWFYIKGHGYLRTPPPSAASTSSPPPQTSTTSNNVPVDDVEMPQLRDFLFATSQASTTPEMISLLETYLNAALSIPVVRSSAYVLSLLQISGGTFDNDAGGVVTSQREGWLKVRMWLKGSQDNVRLHRGTVMCDNGCFNCFCVVKKYSWHTSQWRWVALKDSCVAIYESNRDLTPTDVLLFDGGFKLETGLRAVGSAKEFVVTTSAFVLHCQARHKNECIKWANQIRTAAEASEWTHHRNRRDGSFAMPRPHTSSRAQWYVDGEDTYAAMFAAINAAKTEIFIAGWWICPTTSLLRPATDASRLDLVLQRRAQAGVKIYILMYKEISMALTLDSQYAKKTLRKLHHNIHVLRDPDFIMKQLGLWSHHEKIVCIDQRMAFVGGLDLCFGRWDNARHDLFEPKARTFPGKDYSNPRIKDFVDVHRPDIDLMDRNLNPRMPWHDCHCKLFGEPAKDVARHFIQRWNYSVSTRFKMHRFHHLVPATGCKPTALSSNLPPHGRNSINNNTGNALCVLGFSESTSATTMPPALVSSTDTGTVEGIALTKRSDAGTTDLLDDEVQTSALDENRASDDVAEGFACNCQIVRSLSMWSGGCRTEKSIQNAYIRLINDARYFVYIENQFFVSSMQGDPLCQNLIANALVSRILRAHAANQPFRVMVVLPLLPAFQGKPTEKEAYSLRGVMHWQYRSICRGEGSIYHQLNAAGIPNAFEYIAFFALRTHAVHDGMPHTEQVYIHSKIMIVDDRISVIGSANINERSMSGDRDSEIAAVIEDVEWVPNVTLSGAAVGKFSHSFRMRLFEEHFGLESGGIGLSYREDPTAAPAWMALRQHAMANTNIYEAVFGCLPADSIRSFRDMGVDFVCKYIYLERYSMYYWYYCRWQTACTIRRGGSVRCSIDRRRRKLMILLPTHLGHLLLHWPHKTTTAMTDGLELLLWSPVVVAMMRLNLTSRGRGNEPATDDP